MAQVDDPKRLDSEMDKFNSDSGGSDLDDKDNSSDEMSDDENELEKEAVEFEKRISENAFDYNAYVELIIRLKKLGELERLRRARQQMSENFPLTPDLWLSWLQDEIKLAASDADRKNIYELFERAVQDYLSVEIWLEYAQFSISDMALQDGIVKVHSIFERALTAVGLHVARGAIVWEAFREFENILCAQKLSSNEKQEAEGQYERVVKLFKRQLAVPLLDMENTYAEFHNWIKGLGEEINPKIIEHGYKKALSKLSKILPYEEKLLSCPVEGRSECYRSYIAYEWSAESDPARIQCLYERAIAEDKTPDATLWLEYIEYLNNQLRIEIVVLEACQRAVRNCPWNSSLWQHYLRALERCSRPHEVIKGVMETALSAGFSDANDYLELWLSYLDYLRRRINTSSPENSEMIDELVASFNKACEHLAQSFGLQGDPSCSILQYWARFEAIHRKNMTQCRLLWNDILSQGHDKTAAMWLEYSSLERMYGTDRKHLRRLFARALNTVKDWPESIGTAWLNFERDEGSLDQYENCLMKFKARMKVVTAERERLAAVEAESSRSKPTYDRKRIPERGDKSQGKGYQERKGKYTSKQESNPKQNLEEKGKWSGASHKTYTDTGPAKTNKAEDNDDGDLPALRMPPPPGYKPNVEDGEPPLKKRKADGAASRDDAESKGSVPGPVVHNPAKDNHTVFLSNLDFNVTEDEIRERFGPLGTLNDIRLVKNFKGKSKGYGYLEFSSPSEAIEALKKDRELINGRPMFVSKCDPDSQTRQKVFRYSASIEKNKLFIRDLPFSTTKEDLEELYQTYGTLKEVRLVTFRNGRSKGLAYVEFKDSASASNALMKTDGMVIKDKTISVAISKPPERKADATSLIPSLGGGGDREIGGRGRVKMAASLLPRAVQISQARSQPASGTNPPGPSTSNGESTNGEKGSEDTKKPMSNQDFRQMLLGSKK